MILQRNFLKTVVMLLSLAALAVSVPTLSAQDAMSAGGGSKEAAMQKLEKMSAALQLTPDQKKQVRPILMEEAPKLQGLEGRTPRCPQMQKAMQMRQIANDTDAKLKPILTPQQYQTWEGMREQERQQMMQKMENR